MYIPNSTPDDFVFTYSSKLYFFLRLTQHKMITTIRTTKMARTKAPPTQTAMNIGRGSGRAEKGIEKRQMLAKTDVIIQ